MLEATAFLSNLDEQDVEWLVINAETQQIPAGSVLIRRGKPVECLYLIVEGAFDVTIPAPTERTVARLYAGELVGEMSFVDQNPPSATVTAGMDSRVLAIAKPGLTGKIEQDLRFGSRFYRGVSQLLSGRLRAAFAVELDLGQDVDRTGEMGRLARRFDEIRRRLEAKRLAQSV